MQLKDYITTLASFKRFAQDIKDDRFFHSIMLINKDGEFLRAYANKLASEILANNGADRELTINKVEKEIHPDLMVLGRDKALDVEDVREFLTSVLVAPYEGDRKVYIIERFDELLSAPANKLLKTLEEPPLGVTFVLLVKNETRVLQTLLSRSQKFYLEGFSDELIQSVLKDLGEKEPGLISTQSGHNLEEARKLMIGGNSKRMAEFVFDTFLNLKKTTELAKTVIGAEEFKDSLPEMFSFFANVAELAIRKKANLSDKLGFMIEEKVQKIASEWGYLALSKIIDASITAIKMLEGYVSQSNCLDQFFLKILEVRRKCGR